MLNSKFFNEKIKRTEKKIKTRLEDLIEIFISVFSNKISQKVTAQFIVTRLFLNVKDIRYSENQIRSEM